MTSKWQILSKFGRKSEEKRIKRRRKDNRNKEIRHAKARLYEGKKTLIQLLLDGGDR